MVLGLRCKLSQHCSHKQKWRHGSSTMVLRRSPHETHLPKSKTHSSQRSSLFIVKIVGPKHATTARTYARCFRFRLFGAFCGKASTCGSFSCRGLIITSPGRNSAGEDRSPVFALAPATLLSESPIAVPILSGTTLRRLTEEPMTGESTGDCRSENERQCQRQSSKSTLGTNNLPDNPAKTFN